MVCVHLYIVMLVLSMYRAVCYTYSTAVCYRFPSRSSLSLFFSLPPFFLPSLSLSSSLPLSLSLPLSGVKEAFLKVAQGVISLHQKNQLSNNTNLDPSYSPVSSNSHLPHPATAHAHQSAFFYTTKSFETNGHVMVDSDTKPEKLKSRCC